MEPIRQAVRLVGGPTAVARALGVTPPAVHQWIAGQRQIAAERCPDIERATAGQVTVEELRPDVRWTRVHDSEWPHPVGRPCIDVAAPVVEGERAATPEAA